MKNIKTAIEKSFKKQESYLFSFFIDKDFIAFNGHFPDRPLLPGIVQIEMVLFCVRKMLGRENVVLKEVKKIKFIKSILPKTEVLIELSGDGVNYKAVIKDDRELFSQISIEVA